MNRLTGNKSRCMAAGKDVPCIAFLVLVQFLVGVLVHVYTPPVSCNYLSRPPPACPYPTTRPTTRPLMSRSCCTRTRTRSSMASSSSSSSTSSSSTFTWLADYEITLQPSPSSSSLPINITMPAFNSIDIDEATTRTGSTASPTPPLPPDVDTAATALSPLPGPTWSSPPPPNTPLAKLWTIWRRSGSSSSSSGKHVLAGLAGLPTSTPPEAQPRPFLLADAALQQDKDVCELLLRGLNGDHNTARDNEEKDVEHVSWVDNYGHDLPPSPSTGLPRRLVHRLNILHKGAGILVRDQQKRVFVHQRAAHKRIFPSMYDMFVGGVSLFGEDTRETAGRELKEELGFGREGEEEKEEEAFRFLFHVLIETSYNRCFVNLYEYVVQAGEEEGSVKLDPEEVQWGEWVTMEEVKRRVGLDGREGEWTFVPDGLLVWRALVQAQGGEEGVV